MMDRKSDLTQVAETLGAITEAARWYFGGPNERQIRYERKSS
jgi:hypothetical protein